MIAFGPVSSRRLGLSLGINNIVSHKICSYSCVYCQIGNTADKSMARQAFYEPEMLMKSVENHLHKLDSAHAPDFLTFVANGEPTLDINLGKEIRLLKKLHLPIAVFTNTSLIYDWNIQADLLEADWVSVKVDAVKENIWKEINRPLQSADFDKIMQGLTAFAAIYPGKLNTETMLIDSCNDSSDHLQTIAYFIASLNPQKAYLSVPTRPPTVKDTKAVTESKITEAWQIFEKAGIRTELLTGFEGTDTGFTGNAFEDILNITAVHPLREDVMTRLLRMDKADGEIVNSLLSQGLIKSVCHAGYTYYVRCYHF